MTSLCIRLQLLALLALITLAPGCCHNKTYAYRARVVGPPVGLPGAPVAAAPLPVIPGGQPAIMGTPQPFAAAPQALPATPQPSLGTPLPHTANQPPLVPPPQNSGVVLEKVGPTQATVGALVTYRIEIQAANGGARDVVVNDQLSAGLRYESSKPEATMAGDSLQWRLGDLPGGAFRTIEVNVRAEQAGLFNNCAVARTADGQTSQRCLSTAVVIPELDVRVTVMGSDTINVGDRVTFQVTVTNRGNLPATGLLITDRFDPGLEHEAASSPIEKDLGQLGGGESQTIGVTFRATQPGRLCNRVEVRGEAGVRGAAEGCVTVMMAAPPTGQPPAEPPVTPPIATGPNEASTAQPPARPAVQVKVSGPEAAQSINSLTDFFIEVTNSGERTLSNITVMANPDPSLAPQQATDGYKWDDRDNLVWTIPALAAGKSIRLQIKDRCQKEADKACVHAKVTTDEGATAEDEACIEIRKGQSQLTMKIDDLADPVTVGSVLGAQYEVRIKNEGSVSEHNIVLLIIMPPELEPNKVGTMGPTKANTTEAQRVSYPPVAELPPGETLTYRVRANALKAGTVTVEAIMRSDNMAKSVTEKQETTILEATK